MLITKSVARRGKRPPREDKPWRRRAPQSSKRMPPARRAPAGTPPSPLSMARDFVLSPMTTSGPAPRKNEMEELMERLRENERQMQEQAKSWEERLQETKAVADAQVRELSQQGIHLRGEGQAQLEEKRKTLPHL